MNTRIRPAGRIKCSREKRLDAVLLSLHFIKMLCINPLIKIILQSKGLFLKSLHCNTVPKTAFECQTLPPIYNGQYIISSLYQNVGRKPISPSIRTVRMITFGNANAPAFLMSGMQECRNVYKIEHLLAGNQNGLLYVMFAGRPARW